MYKKSFSDAIIDKRCRYKQFFRIMKISFFLLFLFVFCLSAENTNSQNVNVTLKSNNMELEQILGQIEKQTDFLFVYNNHVNVTRKVSVNLKNVPLYKVLNNLFEGTDVKYAFDGTYILLSTKNAVTKVSASSAVAQQRHTVTGKIVDSRSEPVIGANVVVKGTTNGTMSDVDGKFSLTNVNKGDILEISYIGYVTQNIRYDNQSSLHVVLSENTQALDEVVVVGYGTQRKSDLTGSITTVKGSDIKNVPATTIAEALQGQVAGALIQQESGAPNSSQSFIIRGLGSINSISPLYVVDGVVRTTGNYYNMKDVESIEVIKDASAAAIYGSRAAGGVILITTKSGSNNQKPVVSFSARVGVDKPIQDYHLLETMDYYTVRHGCYGDAWPFGDPSTLPNTNWFNEGYDNGLEQSYDLSLTGGSEKIKYYLSGNYEYKDGIQLKDYWNRMGARLNVEYKLKKNLAIGTHSYLTRVRYDPTTAGDLWRTVPYMNVKNADGSYASIPAGCELSGAGNPIGAEYAKYKLYGIFKADVDAYLNWEIIDGLTFHAQGAAAFQSLFSDDYSSEYQFGRVLNNDFYTKASEHSELYTFTTTLTYEKRFAEKHDLKLMAGFEAKNGMYSNLSATAYDLAVKNPTSFDLSTSSSYLASGTRSKDGRYLSQFARLNYSYDDRYLLTANIRRDGSPKFGPDNRYGVFPSASVGWKIHNEEWFKNLNIKWLTTIKPRYSYGVLGNDMAVRNYLYLPSFAKVNEHSYSGSNIEYGYNNSKVTNSSIKWETVYTSDVGADFGFFNNKLTASVDYYNKDTKDMIYAIAIPQSAGIGDGTLTTNIGEMNNKGWELMLSWRDKIKDFNYGVSLNLSHNKNKLLNLDTEGSYFFAGTANVWDGAFKTEEGGSVGQIWGLKVNGLISSQSEIDALNAKAKEKGFDYYYDRTTGPGDLKYVDLNGDGHISREDCAVIGNPWPKLEYGFAINLGYKGFDFNAIFAGLYGRDVFNTATTFSEMCLQDYQTTKKIFNGSFFNGNGLTNQPRPIAQDAKGNLTAVNPNHNYTQNSEYLIESGSYLKLKNITLGYTFPSSLTRKIGVRDLRIFLTGTNLFTITNFSGSDPEFAGSVTAYSEYSLGLYPQTRTYNLGIDINF